MDMSQYLDVFITECHENLQILNNCLLELEQNTNVQENLRQMFRAAHTIKGAAATMQFENMSHLTHEMENVLDLLRSDQIALTSEIINTLFKCVDLLEAMVFNISENKGDQQVNIEEALQKLGELQHQEQQRTNTAPPTKNSQNRYQQANLAVEVQLVDGCMLRHARAFLVVSRLRQLGQVVATEPQIDNDFKEQSFTVFLNTKNDPEDIKRQVLGVAEIAEVTIQELESANEVASGQDPAALRFRTSPTVRVDINRLDLLMNLVSELVINRTRFTQISKQLGHQELGETTDALNRTILDIQDLVMKIRMIPIESTFNRFPRMVRDLAQQLGKEVELIIEGAETELDRTIIDEIGEPLLHMVRNAIDHGLESPEQRLANNKPRKGRLKLVAFQRGDSVYIEVEDDGRGIDVQKIKAKAVEKGLISQAEARDMSDYDALQLMFRPGFSTAQTISDVSGRGVGLDVVKTKIESLGGRVEVESQLGSGTRFIISLPLTLAIISVLLVIANGHKYAIPLGLVDQTTLVQFKELEMVHDQLTMKYRDSLIPFFFLNDLLYESKAGHQHEDSLYAVVTRKRDQLIAFAVDEVIGQEEIVIKPLGTFVDKVKGISGATILGDGEIALILDVTALV